MCAIGNTGDCSCAGAHVAPPSVVISTPTIVPRPVQAMPVNSQNAPAVSVSPPDGRVMIDLASRSNVNWRAVPSGMRSVYFEVSSRLIAGWFITFSRRSHLTLAFPSQPGSSSRSG